VSGVTSDFLLEDISCVRAHPGGRHCPCGTTQRVSKQQDARSGRVRNGKEEWASTFLVHGASSLQHC